MAETAYHHGRDDSRYDAPVSPIQTEFSRPPQFMSRSDEYDLNKEPVSPIMSRKSSVESDRHSNVSGLTGHSSSNPTNVKPAPAYVAPLNAAQYVSEHQASKNRAPSDTEDDDDKSKDDVKFSEPALALINGFLDQLLYGFLNTARSTSLLALRPAIIEVLKHRLAKDAISNADEELSELLAGGDDEEEDMDAKHKTAENKRKWDLELVWKRTRLRVMVYMQLGEMDNDDEQRYVKQEELFHGSERRFSSSTGLVSWSAAIFLTSVLEYVAEQTLQVAGQAAHTRAKRQSRSGILTAATEAHARDELVVEEYDVEKVALNPTLGRLWRTWRKALRNNNAPGTPTHRSSPSISRMGRENMVSAMSNPRSSFDTAPDESSQSRSRPISRGNLDDAPEMLHPEHILAANIPLPLGDESRDVDEIMVPGLAKDLETEHATEKSAHSTEGSDDAPYPEHVVALLVALPPIDEKRDVDEIELPGLARDPDEEDEPNETLIPKVKRRSSFAGQRTPADFETTDRSIATSSGDVGMPRKSRQRSMSLPKQARTLAKDDPVPDVVTEEHVAEKKPASESEISAKDVADAENPTVVETAPLPEVPVSEVPSQDVTAHDAQPPEAPTSKALPQDATTQDAQTATPKSEFPWTTAGAVAGASTAGAAWAYQSTHAHRNSLDGLIKNANQNDGKKEVGANEVDAEKDRSQQSLSAPRDIEELDKRKSLIDIKSMVASNGSSSAASGRESPATADSQKLSVQRPPTIVRTSSEDTTGSHSYTLGNQKAKQFSSEEGPEDAIGVAVSDAPSGVPRVRKSPSPDARAQQARDAPKRPARLILGDEDLNDQSQAPRTPRQFLDLTGEDDSSPEAVKQASPITNKRTQKPSVTNGNQHSPSIDQSPHRQSFTAAVEKNGSRPGGSSPNSPSIHTKSGSDVQEHPIVQRMASLKGSEPNSAVEEKASPLTSAAIRGPEDFDMFVQGGDTLKYTLTPEHVRDEPMDGRTRSVRSRGSPVELDATSQSSKQQVQAPVQETRTGRTQSTRQATSTEEEREARSKRRRSVSRPNPRNTTAHRKSGLMAREPRVMTESTRDFADFIRSTGPDKDTTVYPILANASSTSLHSLRSAHINGAAASRSSSPSGDRTKSLKAQNVPPVPPIPANTTSKAKSVMQARGPPSKGGDSADLIDFIRSGPSEDGKHSISRNVAPFRTTMDSDQLKTMGDRINGRGKSIDLSSNSEVNGAPSTKSSLRTSANSRSALLPNQASPNGQSKRLSQNLSPAAKTTSPPTPNEPQRQRPKSKDPYSMDFLDDDEDDDDNELLTSHPKKPARKEESWLEFLNSHEPSTSTPPRPLVDPNSAKAKAAVANARANPSYRAPTSAADSGRTRSMPNTNGPRAGYVAGVQAQRSQIQSTVTAPGQQPQQSKMEARTPGSKSRSTAGQSGDLVDFLRSSGPEDGAPAPSVGRTGEQPVAGGKKTEKKKGGGIGIFSRGGRKDRYLDMP